MFDSSTVEQQIIIFILLLKFDARIQQKKDDRGRG
jgi:hypothetical protein